jgi:hypothetical protein
MISTMTNSISGEVAPCQQRSGASPGHWLSMAAAPTFATMALLTSIHGESMPDMLCSAAQGTSLLTGMAAMYVLMSAFHLAPWLRLLPRCRRSGAGQMLIALGRRAGSPPDRELSASDR